MASVFHLSAFTFLAHGGGAGYERLAGRIKKQTKEDLLQMGEHTDEGDHLIAEAYFRQPIGGNGSVRPEDAQTLEDFQAAFAAAEEWESLGFIQIVDSQDEDWTEGSLVHPIRFRRLK